MKRDFLRKIALAVILALLVACFASCKTGGNDEEEAITDEYVEGTQQESSGDTPTLVPNDKNDGSNGNEVYAGNNQNENESSDNEQTNEPSGNEQNNNEQTNTPTENEPNDNESNDNEQNNSGDNGEEEVTKPAFSMDKALKIVSYNIKCAWYGKTIDQVAQQLKEVNADIVGLQEVDCNTSRSTGGNQIETIAAKAGYPYYYFAPVIEYGGDKTKQAPADLKTNAYGHAILSKYPIKNTEIIWPDAQQKDEEVRNFERHEIDVNGKIVAFYNCHLNTTKGSVQYFEIQENYMAKDKYAICVGDFNETLSEQLGIYFDNDKFYSFAFGDNMNKPVMRGEAGKQTQVIDHIIISRDTMTWYDEEVMNGYYVVPHAGASDHNMIYAYVNLLD